MGEKRRPSPTSDDLQRIAETLKNSDIGHEIKDYSSFRHSWNSYFSGDEEMQIRDDLIDKTFDIYADDYSYRMEDAKKTGYAIRGPKRKRQLVYVVFVNKRNTYASKETVKIRGKEQTRYRDRLGRFGSPKLAKNI